jgi:hypothetical protein
MTREDFKQFAYSWMQACEAVGQPATKHQIEWAFNVLLDLDLPAIQDALIKHARDPQAGQFKPKPADIIRHIKGTKADRKDAAVAAFARVLDAVAAHGRYATVVFDDPAIHYAVQIGFGNWPKVADFNEDDFASQEQRRSFISAYASYQHGLQQYPPKLTGMHELTNAAEGQSNPLASITYIGDKQRALAVQNGGSNRGLSFSEEVKALGGNN